MFENVFKILKITKKNFAHFFNKGGGGGGVQNSYNRTEPLNVFYFGLKHNFQQFCFYILPCRLCNEPNFHYPNILAAL